MKERAEQLGNKLKSLSTPEFDSATQVRTLVGIIAIAGMLLPWVRLDGHAGAMNGAEMIAYALTSPERASIFSASKLGTLAVLLVPPLVLAANAYGFFRLMQGHHSLGAHITGALLPLGMILTAGAILNSDGPALMGIPIPGIGLFVTMLAQGALFIDAMAEGKD